MDAAAVKLIALVLFFAGVFTLVYKMLPGMARGGGAASNDGFVVPEDSRFVLALKPFYRLLTPAVKRLPLSNYKARMKKYIVTAGMEDHLSADDMIGFQITIMVFFLFFGIVVFDSFLLPVLLALAGLGYPYLWLYEKKKQRQEKIRMGMPDVVDMLSLSVEAGLAFNVAVQKVCEIFRSDNDPFVAELYLMDQNIKFGRSRNEALKIMAERVDLMELDSFSSTLIQAEKMGSSISDVLKSQSERMRSERFMKAERAGAQASQKILLPMIIFIFPVIFIVIFGPYLIQFIMR